jgi:hypothetical protein
LFLTAQWAGPRCSANGGTAFINGNADLVAAFTELESGKRTDRPELAKALEARRRQRAVGDLDPRVFRDFKDTRLLKVTYKPLDC